MIDATETDDGEYEHLTPEPYCTVAVRYVPAGDLEPRRIEDKTMIDFARWLGMVITAICIVVMIIAGFLTMVGGVVGCNSGGRQASPELVAELSTAVTASLDATLDTHVDATAQAVVAAIADTSQRSSEASQQGTLNTNSTDNSSSDRWLGRLLAAGLVMVAITYPVGKVLWLLGLGVGRQAKRMVVREQICPPIQNRDER